MKQQGREPAAYRRHSSRWQVLSAGGEQEYRLRCQGGGRL